MNKQWKEAYRKAAGNQARRESETPAQRKIRQLRKTIMVVLVVGTLAIGAVTLSRLVFEETLEEKIARAKEGDAVAMYEIGLACYNGDNGAIMSLTKAEHWLLESLRSGYDKAGTHLGLMTWRGEIKRQGQSSKETALMYWDLAAEAGCLRAERYIKKYFRSN